MSSTSASSARLLPLLFTRIKPKSSSSGCPAIGTFMTACRLALSLRRVPGVCVRLERIIVDNFPARLKARQLLTFKEDAEAQHRWAPAWQLYSFNLLYVGSARLASAEPLSCCMHSCQFAFILTCSPLKMSRSIVVIVAWVPPTYM